MTQGQGAYSLTFSHYEEVPREYAAKIIEEERKLNPVVHHEE
jgi:translation elongation factor EF-G